ncbi:MAG: ankyrin repeat domain-containing protein [Myxococcota bacterium]
MMQHNKWIGMAIFCLFAPAATAMHAGQLLQPPVAARFPSCVNLIEATQVGDIKDVQGFLVWHDADPNEQDSHGKSAVHHACEQGDTIIVRILVDNCGDLHVQDNQGKTPLHYAAAGGYAEVCRLLMQQGALLYLLDHDGNTPIDLAKKQGHDTLVKTLHSAQQKQLAILQSALLQVTSPDIAQIISEFAGHKW